MPASLLWLLTTETTAWLRLVDEPHLVLDREHPDFSTKGGAWKWGEAGGKLVEQGGRHGG